MLKYSRPELVVANPPAPSRPPAILGSEPPHTWCYFFEKADLAAWQGDWRAVSSLGDQTAVQRLAPRDRSEWLIFIEGYARTGAYDKARLLSRALLDEPRLQSSVCMLWQELVAEPLPIEDSKTLPVQIYSALGCKE